MAPGALHKLADDLEPRAPGLAVFLREWALCLQHDDPRSVAVEALAALDRAKELAVIVPGDEVNREAITVLTEVLLKVAVDVFRRDARGGSHAC